MALERSLESLSDDELLRGLVDLLRQSRRAETELVVHIGEVDGRRLYAREGFPSMYVYCVEGLRLSEAEAYLRIHAARAARRHPVLLEMLGAGGCISPASTSSPRTSRRRTGRFCCRGLSTRRSTRSRSSLPSGTRGPTFWL